MALKRMTPAKKGAAKKARSKSANAVTKPEKLSVDAYIAGLENANRRAEAETLVKIFDKATGWPAQMWGPSIIGYGRYSYTYESGRQGDSCILGFSPRKGAISLYVYTSSPETAALLAKLGKTRKEVGCVYVNKLADIDLALLEKLVKTGKAASLKTYKERDWPVSAT
jgi:Domain of unknown function (DU1801)